MEKNHPRQVKGLYEKIVSAESLEERREGMEELTSYKEVRDSIEGVISSLMEEEDEDKLKKVVVRGLRGVSGRLYTLYLTLYSLYSTLFFTCTIYTKGAKRYKYATNDCVKFVFAWVKSKLCF